MQRRSGEAQAHCIFEAGHHETGFLAVRIRRVIRDEALVLGPRNKRANTAARAIPVPKRSTRRWRTYQQLVFTRAAPYGTGRLHLPRAMPHDGSLPMPGIFESATNNLNPAGIRVAGSAVHP
jgi:hypothetical protein